MTASDGPTILDGEERRGRTFRRHVAKYALREPAQMGGCGGRFGAGGNRVRETGGVRLPAGKIEAARRFQPSDAG